MLGTGYINFSQKETVNVKPLFYQLKNTFTYECWVRPENIISIKNASTNSKEGVRGQSYLIAPGHGGENGNCGSGISVGRNGIAVFEHAHCYLSPTLVHQTNIEGWIHIAIVYQDKTPSLYLNGRFIKSGLKSLKTRVFASGIFGGDLYGYFQGDVNEIRFWNYARNEADIRNFYNKELTGAEEGLFGYWTCKDGQGVRLTDKTKFNNHGKVKGNNKIWRVNKPDMATRIKVESKTPTEKISIIIPSYNRYPQNLLTLYSLEQQTFDPEKMEVIFVDDHSTDETAQIVKDFHPKFIFKYFRSSHNIGRAKARNWGIEGATGDLLIFLDAEMVVNPDFVEKHYRYHQNQENVVVNGGLKQKGLISVVDPKFNEDQSKNIVRLSKSNSIILEKFNECKKVHRPIQVLNKEDITTLRYNNFTFDAPYFSEITRYYGDDLKGYHLPWITFLSNNFSIRKELLKKVGFFNEDFVGWGIEDTELGYRLFLHGVNFICGNEVQVFHQEHLTSPSIWEDLMKNYRKFQKIYNNIDVLLLGLVLAKLKSRIEINEIFIDYKFLSEEYPEQFILFKKTFRACLEVVSRKLSKHEPINNVLNLSDTFERERIKSEIVQVKNLKKYKKLVQTFEQLANL